MFEGAGRRLDNFVGGVANVGRAIGGTVVNTVQATSQAIGGALQTAGTAIRDATVTKVSTVASGITSIAGGVANTAGAVGGAFANAWNTGSFSGNPSGGGSADSVAVAELAVQNRRLAETGQRLGTAFGRMGSIAARMAAVIPPSPLRMAIANTAEGVRNLSNRACNNINMICEFCNQQMKAVESSSETSTAAINRELNEMADISEYFS